MILETDFARNEGERRSQHVLVRRLARLLRQLRQVEHRVAQPVGTEAHAAADRTHRLLEHQHHFAIAEAGRRPLQPKQHRGADRRMAGKGKLPRRREDADRGAVHRPRGRHHEHRLGQVELPRDRLHPRLVEAVAIEDHGERVAGEGPVGEHVQDGVAPGHRGTPVLRAR